MATNTGTPLLLTVDEACERLHLSRPVVYELINSGQLSSIKIGRARRIPLEALRTYIQVALDTQGSGGNPPAA